jgi:hypothetical protein
MELPSNHKSDKGDKEPYISNFSANSVTFATLLAIATIVVPIIWQWWDARTELTVERKQALTILQKESSIQKLSIYYDGKSISSLSKTILTLKNTGNKPIVEADIVSPPTINISADEILDVSVTRQLPSNLGAVISNDNHKIIISFPLLNSGDEIELSILTNGGIPTYTVDARIKNINSITMMAAPKRLSRFRENIEPIVYPQLLSAFFLMFLALMLLSHIPKIEIAKINLLNENGAFYSANTKTEFEHYLNNELYFIRRRKMPAINDFLTSHQFPLSVDDKSTLKKLILDRLDGQYKLRRLDVTVLFIFSVGGFVSAFNLILV